MIDPKAFRVGQLLGALQEALRAAPDDVGRLCEIGRELAQLGRATEARKCYRAATEALRRFARAGDVDAALLSEKVIYEAFVRIVEDEEHYYRCFSDWTDDLARLGRRFARPLDASGQDPGRIAFILHAGHMLGHTEVLFEYLERLKAAPRPHLRPRLFVLTNFDAAFVERVQALGVETVLLDENVPGGKDASLHARLLWLAECLREERFGVCVWVSVPVWSAMALSMRFAPVQIFWALRFHPVSGPFIDGYISWGTPGEKTRRYGKRDWDVVPMPLALDDSQPDSREVAAVRDRYPQAVLLGTLAREDNISSPPYLRAVADVLTANPQCGFVWTGRAEHPGVAAFFREAGVDSRCHFAGWVDTRVHAAALDVFLETFPFGSGITSLQALGAGTPLLSYLHPETIFGTYFWPAVTGRDRPGATPARQPVLEAPDRYPILCARDTAEYASLAGRLVADAPWRKAVGSRGRTFFLEELGRNAGYADLFFDTVERITSGKLGAPRA